MTTPVSPSDAQPPRSMWTRKQFLLAWLGVMLTGTVLTWWWPRPLNPTEQQLVGRWVGTNSTGSQVILNLRTDRSADVEFIASPNTGKSQRIRMKQPTWRLVAGRIEIEEPLGGWVRLQLIGYRVLALFGIGRFSGFYRNSMQFDPVENLSPNSFTMGDWMLVREPTDPPSP